ncbi:hypothetical protein CHGG_09138 [Chaetomium globosum CBS 148.51]|uniref:Uncharacterized protein n=1 Tax=Chaetomium globosum (strain ATCC 6205 / CBS 148.51 / DSM 1962 / NBRC 6347 / NRRL 1970) TaxID=306901 RepID=Q2GSB6_CHAGB|nr:uncharacterized protein CHGG_09138 [Chaetomium globosum CBS 148.51]EAQ85124.1 hypothetical protein CHGG_09138 [Chaetomium globosum CBS 148.51]
MADSGHSPTDIITSQKAVLGVLPILYNTIATLVALSRIRRMLRHSKLTALTRSDVVNRVIEVELPRYAVRPMDRLADRDEYWTLSRHPSSIPGGSWTTFNWRMNVIGLNTQRVEYADQLRQPQVEVALDELVSYLLDLGAQPDPNGWRLLRSSGLWTPVGCTLMRAPDGLNSALTIAPLDGSDGHLSLAVTWTGPWTTRDHSHLPPYWVRLYPPPPPRPAAVEEDPSTTEPEDGASSKSATERRDSNEPLQKATSTTTSLRKPSLNSAQQEGASNARQPITCQISSDGIVTALSRPDNNNPLPQEHDHDQTLHIEHLRIRSTTTTGTWFASAATAYGTSSQTILWNYKIPDGVLGFARRETVPCGVLVLLGVVDESATPEWASASAATLADDRARQLDEFSRRARAQREAVMAEARMSPAERAVAQRERGIKEAEGRLWDMRERQRVEAQRREARLIEALQSPKWDAKLVAEHSLAWLVKNGEVDERVEGVKEAVGGVLHRMVLDGQFATKLCQMLDLWKAWAENAGMRRSDLEALQGDQITFAYATLLVAIIKDTSTALEGTVAMDLQECLRMWRTVRLG